jgi:hypothetical protein
MASKEGLNRAERGGKDDKGTYGGPMAGATDPIAEKAGASGVSGAGSSVTEGAKGAVSSISGALGGGKKE